MIMIKQVSYDFFLNRRLKTNTITTFLLNCFYLKNHDNLRSHSKLIFILHYACTRLQIYRELVPVKK